jgi:hypothetical protein
LGIGAYLGDKLGINVELLGGVMGIGAYLGDILGINVELGEVLGIIV